MLFRKVMEKYELCCKCGVCSVICPYYTKPKCKECRERICLEACPQLVTDRLSIRSVPEFKKAYTSRSKIPKILSKAQDGGTVTTLLVTLLEEKLTDYVIVVKATDPLTPRVQVTDSIDDVIDSAGSKYTFTPLPAIFREVIRKEIKRLSIVGLPCHLRAVESILKYLKLNFDFLLRIGLFCSHSFHKHQLEKVFKELNLDSSKISKINIKKNLIITLTDGRTYEYSLKKIETPKSCTLCPELISNYCDVAVGSMGSEDGWNTVLVLTDLGLEVINMALRRNYLEVKELSIENLSIVEKFAKRKFEKAQKTYSSIREIIERIRKFELDV